MVKLPALGVQLVQLVLGDDQIAERHARLGERRPRHRADRAPAVVIDGSVAEHLEVLRVMEAVGLGVTELSVPPAAIAEIKQVLRQIDMPSAAMLAAKACDAPDAATVRALVRAYMGERA